MFTGTIQNILGEILWHSITRDTTLQAVSRQHLDEVTRVLKKYNNSRLSFGRKLQVLEVAAYAHTTGYQLAKLIDADVTLTDISIDTLALGKTIAAEENIDGTSVIRIAADFHDLPFETGCFDLVYIASALHHTWNWQQVLGELIRVTASAGLLFIENEPCARELCFYKFRTNRADQYCELERHLASVGFLRTFSEPYLGSRPEELFGMVENQTMPLDEIIKLVSDSGDIKELVLMSDICMGEFENQLIEARHKGLEYIRNLIRRKLIEALALAQQYLGKNEIEIGYSLPDVDEILELSEKVSASIDALDQNKKSELYKLGLAKLFGASIKIVMKKHGQPKLVHAPLKYNWGVRKDVIMGYPQYVQSVLNGTVDLLPDIQRANIPTIQTSFPQSEWNIYQDDAGVRSISPLTQNAYIQCHQYKRLHHLLILLRIYAVYDGNPFQLFLKSGDACLTKASLKIYQTGSYLLRAQIDSDAGLLKLTFSTEYLNKFANMEQIKNPIYNISAARICGI